MDDLQLELSFSGPDDPQSSEGSDDDIDSSGVEEVEDEEDSDASDTVEETVEQPPPPPGAMKENNNNKFNKSKLKHNGDELFPPGGSKGSRASKAWVYGGLKKDGKGKLLTDKMYCGLCPKEFKYNQSPGGLTEHLFVPSSLKLFKNTRSQR